jgi:hypothetical protein
MFVSLDLLAQGSLLDFDGSNSFFHFAVILSQDHQVLLQLQVYVLVHLDFLSQLKPFLLQIVSYHPKRFLGFLDQPSQLAVLFEELRVIFFEPDLRTDFLFDSGLKLLTDPVEFVKLGLSDVLDLNEGTAALFEQAIELFLALAVDVVEAFDLVYQLAGSLLIGSQFRSQALCPSLKRLPCVDPLDDLLIQNLHLCF